MRHLALWPDEAPLDDEHAAVRFERLRASEAGEEPSPLLLSFIAEITGRFPEDEEGDSVWGSYPLRGEASGRLLYLGVHRNVDEVVPVLVHHALRYHLNVFDPGSGRLLTAARHDD